MKTKNYAEELAEKDKKFLWHPFTQMRDWQEEDVLVMKKGEGVWLEDFEGKRYIDGVSSLWCNVHGHRVPELDRALTRQLTEVAHSTFLGLSNEPAILLAEELLKIAPKNLSRVFYSDSGSEAVEVALKMAYQYWQHKGRPEKAKFVKLTESYHGDTLGSVSVGGIGLFHKIYKPLLFETFSAPTPFVYRWPTTNDPEKVCDEAIKALEDVLAGHHAQIAALLMEPLMQGAAGMIRQPAGYISRARDLARKYNVLLIFDEVATGFGRTGAMFASHWEQVEPDLMAVAKGITGGYLPLAATLASEEIYSAFLGRYEEFKTFFHGHTYTANPLACRVALANLELFKTGRVLENLQPKIQKLTARLADFNSLKAVGDIRQAGFMVGIELVKDRASKETFPPERKIGHNVILRARRKGVILRPLGPVIVLMPPLSISETELAMLLDVTFDSIKEETEK